MFKREAKMCTVTFIPNSVDKKRFFLTSNRDEAAERETLPPEIHFLKSKKMLFPQDKLGGGTWIGVSENQRTACLLNGAFKPHRREASYRKSRGLIVLELLAAKNTQKFIDSENFVGIEPFTMIIVDYSGALELREFVWDGEKKHFKQLPLVPQIWSSAPLYSEEMKKERNAWFFQFLKNNNLTATDLWSFHHTAGTGDKQKDLIIDRGFLKTKSITQIEKFSTGLDMRYKDLENQEEFCLKFN